MLDLFNKINIIIQPLLAIISIVNTLMLSILFIAKKVDDNDKFTIQIKNNEICFMNNGKYSIKISKIDIKYIEYDGIYADFYHDSHNLIDSPVKIKGKNKIIIKFTPNLYELQKSNYNLYLCFDITSDSGRNYDSICCKLLNHKKKLITRKRKLSKELWFI